MRIPLKQSMLIGKYIARQKRAGSSRFPLVMMLEPLFACNFSCSGCGRIHEYKEHATDMLSPAQALKAIDECGAPVVSICGGEPLMYPHIQELVEKTLARKRVVYLCTNGWALDKKLGLFTPHPLFNINIHIDGTAAVHDAIVEREGAYAKAVHGIRLAKERGFTVCTNTTVYKQTETADVVHLMSDLRAADVDGMLLSPGFEYREVPDQTVFLDRNEINAKFRELRQTAAGRRVWSTPLFLDFLAGEREYRCTPWGNVTYNVRGWKAPCYLITDRHFSTFDDFMNGVDWDAYGPGMDPRCRNCMCHCGFESTVALATGTSMLDALRMIWWAIR